MNSLSITIPCYNEEQNVLRLENELIPAITLLPPEYSIELSLLSNLGSVNK